MAIALTSISTDDEQEPYADGAGLFSSDDVSPMA